MEIQETQEQPTEQPKVEQPDQTQESSQTQQPDDLLSRVTKFVETENPENKSDVDIDKELFNDVELRQTIDSIEDENLKTQFVSLRKSLMRGANDKFQEIAELRKDIQSLKQQDDGKWTPEKIQKIMNDPDFVSAAQQVTGTATEDDEYVPESVKNKLKELDVIKEQLGQWQNTLSKSQSDQAHQTLSEKYGNYNRGKIDEISKNLLEQKVMPSYDDIYKVINHDDNVKRAYEMGLKDRNQSIGEKIEANSFDGGSQTQNLDIKPEEKETNKQFWSRIAQKNLASMIKK